MSSRFVVPPGTAPLRLDAFLTQTGQLSRRQARALIEAGSVFVNRKRVAAGHRHVGPGDTIQVNAAPPPREREQPGEIAVLYEDEWIIVIDKPAGMPAEPTPQTAMGTALDAVERHLKAAVLTGGLIENRTAVKPRVVHRLDKDVTGALVMALGKVSAAHLSKQFRAHTAGRIYLAVVEGQPHADEGQLVHYLRKGEGGTMIAEQAPPEVVHLLENPPEEGSEEAPIDLEGDDRGRLALTTFRVRARGQRHSLLEISLQTGRTHQIRAQLAAVELPLVGDPRYGHAPDDGSPPLLARPALHAWHLYLRHPERNNALHFEAPVPEDLRALLATLEMPLPEEPTLA